MSPFPPPPMVPKKKGGTRGNGKGALVVHSLNSVSFLCTTQWTSRELVAWGSREQNSR